jgi:hypothetical protein
MTLSDSDISSFGDYLIFVDESGDHNLGASIDKDFPVFVLMFLVVNKHEYTEKIVPTFQRLKLKYWGHDQAIFHEREIRKKTGYFKLFDQYPNIKYSFYDDLNGVMIPIPSLNSVLNIGEIGERFHPRCISLYPA